jgi:hypothetical protein
MTSMALLYRDQITNLYISDIKNENNHKITNSSKIIDQINKMFIHL